MRHLTPLEARVLGVLVEKQATVPDTYPLSLNALVNGCNQKTAREPVIEASEADVLVAIDGLKSLSLVFEGSGSRVVKYEQNMARALALPGAAVALLAVLMLRGPQTAAELRLNCERLHRFADISAAEGFLEELAAKDPPRAVKLPRAPGEREARWAQVLTGDAPVAAAMARHGAAATMTAAAGTAPARGTATFDVSAGELSALKAEQTRLAAEVAELRDLVQRIARELGVQT
ncbi:MAG: YceH family protein [Rubrivivax sp.]